MPQQANAGPIVPPEWESSAGADPWPALEFQDGLSSVKRETAAATIDALAIAALATIVFALITPLRMAVGLPTSLRSLITWGIRAEAASSASGSSLTQTIVETALTQAAIAIALLWVIALPVSLIYVTAGSGLVGATIGRLMTRTRLRSQDGSRLGFRESLLTGMVAATYCTVPPLAAANALVFATTLGQVRLRLGQRIAGTQGRTMKRPTLQPESGQIGTTPQESRKP